MHVWLSLLVLEGTCTVRKSFVNVEEVGKLYMEVQYVRRREQVSLDCNIALFACCSIVICQNLQRLQS